MLSIGTTHVSGWRGFNFGKNDAPEVEHEFLEDDAPPLFIASARHFVGGYSADYSRPSIEMED